MYPECQYFYAILNACCNSPQSKIITSCVWCISLIVLIWPVRNDFDLFPFFKCVFLFRPGNYRTQLYDKQKEEYLPATQGLGMFVEVKDPDEKVCLNGCPESNKSPIVIVFHHHLICVSFFLTFRWSCPASMDLRAGLSSPPTHLESIKSACTQIPPNLLCLPVGCL